MEQFGFRSDDFQGDAGFDAYRDLYSVGSNVERIGDAFSVETQLFRFPRMLVMNRTLSGLSHERDHKRVSSDGFDHVNIQLVVSGRMLLSTEGTPRLVEAGQIAVFDMTQPQRTWTLGARIISASLPREMLATTLPPGLPTHGLVLTEGTCALLGDVLRSLVRTGPSANVQIAEAATSTIGTLLGTTLGSVSGFVGGMPLTENAKRERTIAYIESALDRPNLAVDEICVAVAMSRSALYRLFEPLGGVAHYIHQRRLIALRRTMIRRGEIRPFTTLANIHGFANASYASRSFKEIFGMTPGDFRAALRVPDVARRTAVSAGRETLARWTVELL